MVAEQARTLIGFYPAVDRKMIYLRDAFKPHVF